MLGEYTFVGPGPLLDHSALIGLSTRNVRCSLVGNGQMGARQTRNEIPDWILDAVGAGILQETD